MQNLLPLKFYSFRKKNHIFCIIKINDKCLNLCFCTENYKFKKKTGVYKTFYIQR